MAVDMINIFENPFAIGIPPFIIDPNTGVVIATIKVLYNGTILVTNT